MIIKYVNLQHIFCCSLILKRYIYKYDKHERTFLLKGNFYKNYSTDQSVQHDQEGLWSTRTFYQLVPSQLVLFYIELVTLILSFESDF